MSKNKDGYICIWKIIYPCEKRPTHMRRDPQKRPYTKRDLYKRLLKERLLRMMSLRNKLTSRAREDTDGYLCIWKNIYTYEKRPIHVKRDLKKRPLITRDLYKRLTTINKDLWKWLVFVTKLPTRLSTHMKRDLYLWKETNKRDHIQQETYTED